MNPRRPVERRHSGRVRLWFFAAGVIVALTGVGVAYVAQRHLSSSSGVESAGATTTAPTTEPTDPQSRLAKLASLTAESMKVSRPALLGSRDPTGPSCVTVVKTGDLKGERPN